MFPKSHRGILPISGDSRGFRPVSVGGQVAPKWPPRDGSDRVASGIASGEPAWVNRQGPPSWERVGKAGTWIGRNGGETWVAVAVAPVILRRERRPVTEATHG